MPPKKKNAAKNAHENDAPAVEAASASVKYAEVQANEIEVLKAIFIDDYEETAVQQAWNKTTEHSFRLTIRSSWDDDDVDSVILVVKFTATYPKSPPILSVEGLDKVHDRTKTRILNIIQSRPKQLLGGDMIHDIAEEIREALVAGVEARRNGAQPSLDVERATAEEMAKDLEEEAAAEEARRSRESEEQKDRSFNSKGPAAISRTGSFKGRPDA